MLQGLKDRGYTLQDNEAEQLVSHLDTDTSGSVDYLDWLAAMVDWHKVPRCDAWSMLLLLMLLLLYLWSLAAFLAVLRCTRPAMPSCHEGASATCSSMLQAAA